VPQRIVSGPNVIGLNHISFVSAYLTLFLRFQYDSTPYPADLPSILFNAQARRHILQASVMDALNAEAEKVRLMTEDHNSLEPPLRSRSDSRSSERTLLNMSDTEMDEKRRSGDLEKEAATDGLLPKVEIKDHLTEDPLKRAKLIFWMAVNTVATVLIVSCYHPSTFRRRRARCGRTTIWPLHR